MKHIAEIIGLVSSLVAIALIAFLGTAKAEQDPFNHGRFYEAKMEISGSIIDIAGAMKNSPNKADFREQLTKRLDQLKAEFPIDHTVIVVENDGTNPEAPDMVAVTLIAYEDEKGFIAWKFDTVFHDNQVFAFVMSLPDRNIPDVGWEQYYRYKVIK